MYKRLIDIIVDLSYERDWSLEQMANKYRVSAQTIRNDISAINELLAENHFRTITIKKGSIYRPDNFTEIKRFINIRITELNLYNYHLSKEELIIMILLILLFEEKYITINRISELLYVSRTTILNSINGVRNYADKLGLNKIAARWPAKAVTQFFIPKLKSSGNQVLIIVLLSCDTKQSNRIDIPTAYDKNNTLPPE